MLLSFATVLHKTCGDTEKMSAADSSDLTAAQELAELLLKPGQQ